MNALPQNAKEIARQRHADQTRKGAAEEPYFCHLEEVAGFVTRHGGDAAVIAAAWLHDTVEDCPTTSLAELSELFGSEVANLVAELTDDKSLPKAERKRLQIEQAPKKSHAAALIKLGDKISNVAAVAASTPSSWDLDRCLAYLDWAESVVGNLPPSHPTALAEFRTTLTQSRNVLSDRAK